MRKSIVIDASIFVLSQVCLFYTVKWMLGRFDPARGLREDQNKKSAAALKRMGTNLALTSHEQIIASEIIWPDDIPVGFADIGGLEHIIDSLKETVIYPLVYPELFESVSGLLGPPKGVLLYGPPGCGKTMLAKALARESQATFINLHVSTLTEKWFGESQKLVNALFSLASKLQPCIIFIDEIDAFLRERKSHDNEATSMMKAEFMTLWDGLQSAKSSRVVILGATNRPSDIDKAILRRMPKRFAIELPSTEQRKKILKKIVMDPSFDVGLIATATHGFSCSDLKELCRNAVMVPVREAIKIKDIKDTNIKTLKVRAVTGMDFLAFIETDIALGQTPTLD